MLHPKALLLRCCGEMKPACSRCESTVWCEFKWTWQSLVSNENYYNLDLWWRRIWKFWGKRWHGLKKNSKTTFSRWTSFTEFHKKLYFRPDESIMRLRRVWLVDPVLRDHSSVISRCEPQTEAGTTWLLLFSHLPQPSAFRAERLNETSHGWTSIREIDCLVWLSNCRPTGLFVMWNSCWLRLFKP